MRLGKKILYVIKQMNKEKDVKMKPAGILNLYH